MAVQTCLEKKGFERRQVELARSDYNKNDEYSVTHDHAKTHNDTEHPHGKGTGHGGHTFNIPDCSLGQDRIIPQLDTTDGGGSYDKFGYRGIGGREYLKSISLYNESNAYSENYVDTSANVADGQYQVKVK